MSLKDYFYVFGQFVSGFIVGGVAIGLIHKLIFYRTIFVDPNRSYVWHDWLSLFLSVTVGILLGVTMARDARKRKSSTDV